MPSGGSDSRVFRSTNDGQNWSAVGASLPLAFLPLTIDVAPSDSSRIYVSGRLGGASNFASALLRSRDGGATFEQVDIPETAEHHLAYIAAVHSSSPDVIYVRVFNPNGTALFETADAGTTFRKVFVGTDQLLGFAVSPDGSTVAFGGPGDGIWTMNTDGSGLARRSNVRPTCLGWSTQGLYACADQRADGFSIGRSRDDGATFESSVRFDDLCADTGCAAASSTAMTCAEDWKVVGPTLGSACGSDAAAAESEAPDPAIPVDAGLDAADAPSSHESGEGGWEAGGGCALAGSRAVAPSRAAEAAGFVLAVGSWLRRARRRRKLSPARRRRA
jgi:hypothetical protein